MGRGKETGKGMEKMVIWKILLTIVCVLCICLGLVCLRIRAGLYALCRQLEEVAQGSHMELTTGSRQGSLLTLCRLLNQILREKDRSHLQYEQAEKQLKQNITGLAHDIRTPLTGAYGYLQMAQESADDAKREHYLQAAKARMSELEEMLEELFLYTKVTSQDFQLSIQQTQVLPVLSDCLLSLYARFEASGVSPKVEFESERYTVPADREALRRIFLNLIQNALIHGEGGITIRQSGNHLLFENPISGGNQPDPAQLFDKFYKSDPARGRGSSGLGLFIVRELMRKMGGDASACRKGNLLQISLHFPDAKNCR